MIVDEFQEVHNINLFPAITTFQVFPFDVRIICRILSLVLFRIGCNAAGIVGSSEFML